MLCMPSTRAVGRSQLIVHFDVDDICFTLTDTLTVLELARPAKNTWRATSQRVKCPKRARSDTQTPTKSDTT